MRRFTAVIAALVLISLPHALAADMLDSGMSGDKVTALSLKLVDLGFISEPTDIYDEKLVSAVGDFQTANGIERTGTADDETLQLVYSLSAVSRSEYLTYIAEKYSGMTPDMADIQTRLADLGYYDGQIDASYNAKTLSAVREYRNANGLDDSDEIDEAMLFMLYEGRSVTADEALAAGCVSNGDTGAGVRRVQKRLGELGYFIGDITGTFGYNTLGAVVRFQENNDIRATGMVDEATYDVLFSDSAAAAGGYMMFIGTSGDDVFALQNRLKALGFLDSDPDGVFSLDTQTAVMLFCASQGLEIQEEVSLELYDTINSVDADPSVVPKLMNTAMTGDELEEICLRAQTMTGITFTSPSENGALGYSFLRNLFASIGLDTGSVDELAQCFEETSETDCTGGDILMFTAENGETPVISFAVCVADGSVLSVSPDTLSLIKTETEAIPFDTMRKFRNTQNRGG